jgi:dihydrolipoamide dehydrogenase
MLAHKAEEDGIACAEWLVTGYGHVDYDTIPGVVYTHPEIASVGRSEDELKAAGRAYRKGVFPFQGNGRARSLARPRGGESATGGTDRVGIHYRSATETYRRRCRDGVWRQQRDIARVCHAHPTLASR